MTDLPSIRDMLVTMFAKIASQQSEDDTRWWTANVKKLAVDALAFDGPSSKSGHVKDWDPEYLVDASVSRDIPASERAENDPFGVFGVSCGLAELQFPQPQAQELLCGPQQLRHRRLRLLGDRSRR